MEKEIQKKKTLTKNPFGSNDLLDGVEKDKNNPFLKGLLQVSFKEGNLSFLNCG